MKGGRIWVKRETQKQWRWKKEKVDMLPEIMLGSNTLISQGSTRKLPKSSRFPSDTVPG